DAFANGQFTSAQTWEEYDGTIPMNIVTIVGDAGNSYSTAMSQIAAVPLNVRSNGQHMAAGLLLPDDILPYTSPLDEWMDLAGNSISELVYIGTVSNPEHTALTGYADTFTQISGIDHFEVAANIAEQFFHGTDSLVLAYAYDLTQPYSSEVIHNV
ncbi:MAG: hypothetical protein ACFFAY_14210, partial [Promethearchaeota archaeon]